MAEFTPDEYRREMDAQDSQLDRVRGIDTPRLWPDADNFGGDRLANDIQESVAAFEGIRNVFLERLREIEESEASDTGALYYSYGFDEHSLESERYGGGNTFTGGPLRNVMIKHFVPGHNLPADIDICPELHIVTNDVYMIKENGKPGRAILSRGLFITPGTTVDYRVNGDVVMEEVGLKEMVPETLAVNEVSSTQKMPRLDLIWQPKGEKMEIFSITTPVNKLEDRDFQKYMKREKSRNLFEDAWEFGWWVLEDTNGRTPDFINY